jgi:hypothetical protein
MPQQQGLPAWVVLNASNDTSASGMADVYTSFPYNAGGLVLGDYFDLTNSEAYRNCKPSVGTLYCGRYRRIQVDSGATAANVKTGTIGMMPSLAAIGQDVGTGPQVGSAAPPSMNVVTSYDQSIGGGSKVVRPVVFLNAITPGNFGWVQELGVASVLGKSALTATTPAIGDVMIVTTGGVVDDPTQSTSLTYTLFGSIVGVALDIPFANKAFRILMSEFPTVQD